VTEVPSNIERRPNGAALVIAAILLAIAALLVWDASRLGGAASYARIGPATFAYAIGAFLAVLSVWTAWTAMWGDFPHWDVPDISPAFWIAAGMIVQMVLLKPLGFSIATGLLFALTVRGFGRKPLWQAVAVGIPLAFLIWIVFARLLMLALPAGPLERLIP